MENDSENNFQKWIMMAERLTELIIGQAKLSVVLGDITGQSTDGIVNAANPGLMGGSGVDKHEIFYFKIGNASLLF